MALGVSAKKGAWRRILNISVWFEISRLTLSNFPPLSLKHAHVSLTNSTKVSF
jgi:hypothetical protein